MGLLSKGNRPEQESAPASKKKDATYPDVYDERTTWVNCLLDGWLYGDAENVTLQAHEGVYDLSLEDAEVDGRDGLAVFQNGEPVLAVSKSSKAYAKLEPLRGRKLWLVAGYRQSREYGDYYRVRVVLERGA